MLIHFPLSTTLVLFCPGKTRLLYPASQLYFISLFTISVIPFVMPGVLLLLRNLESSSELCCLSSGAWQGWHTDPMDSGEKGERSRSWGVKRRFDIKQKFKQLGKPMGCNTTFPAWSPGLRGKEPSRDRRKAGAAELGSPSLQGILSHSLLLPFELPLCSFCSCCAIALHWSFPKFQFSRVFLFYSELFQVVL